ncbi:MAG: DUF1573 domain-containing protein [Muribaculaceae bacterium]|nr:DUF1573 domain-containing protein [Muribaculaceae bacterium]
MKSTLKVVIVLMLCLFVGISAEGKKKKGEGTPKLKFTENVFDFGKISENGGMVSHEFEFINIGNDNLVILDATAQCGCTRPSFTTNPVAPGKKGKIKVAYNPKGRPGSFNKDVTVRTNGSPKKVTVKIKGNVVD